MTRNNLQAVAQDTRDAHAVKSQQQAAASLGNRVRGLRVSVRGKGVVVRGRSRTFYEKQLAQHAVMKTCSLPIVSNEIQVAGGGTC